MGQEQSVLDGVYISDAPQIDSSHVKITDEDSTSFFEIYFHTVPSLSKKEEAQIKITGQGKSLSGTLEVLNGKEFTYTSRETAIWPPGEYTLTIYFRAQYYYAEIFH